MNNLVNFIYTCPEEYSILQVILFIKTILKFVFYVVPIFLIALMSFDFFKNIISNDESTMKKNSLFSLKRLIFCAAMFLVPTIVNFVSVLLGDVGIDYATYVTCANNTDIQTVMIKKANSILKEYEENVNGAFDSELESLITNIKDKNVQLELKTRYEDIKEEFIAEQMKAKEESEKDSKKSSATTRATDQQEKGLWVAHQKNDKDRVAKAIADGFWGIEVDVNQSGNIFKLYHDTYHGYNLDEFLDTCKKNNIIAVLDLKTISDYSKLVSVVKQKGMLNKAIFQTGNTSVVSSLHQADSNSRIWFLNSAGYDSLKTDSITKIKDKIEAVNMLALAVDESVIKKVHDMGLKICAFSYLNGMYPTYGKSAEQLKSWGVDYLAANAIEK